MFYFYKILSRILASTPLLIARKCKAQIRKSQYTLLVFRSIKLFQHTPSVFRSIKLSQYTFPVFHSIKPSQYTLPLFHSIKLPQYTLPLFHSIKPSQYTLPVFFVGLSFILTSCTSVPIERETPKQPDPVKQEECKKTGKGDCKESCEDRCDDVFDKESHQKKCYEYSAELVSDFEDLITATERGKINDIEDIGHDVLNCMLDIDEQGFAKAVREMSRGGAKEFALLIANDKDFAAVLEEEDDEFNVLKQLLNRLAGSSNLYRGLSREIEDGKTLLWLFAESNERAWKWLDNYIEEECDGEDSDDCPGGENIGAYCKALTESGFSRTEWEEFLSEAELFEENYASEVKDADYEYTITSNHDTNYEGDFRDFCFLTAGTSSGGSGSSSGGSGSSSGGSGSSSGGSGSSSGSGVITVSASCPTSSPSTEQTLANVQLERPGVGSQPYKYYIHPDYRSSNGMDPANFGTTTPEQNILLYMQTRATTDGNYPNFVEIGLNDDAISFNQARDYYIYIDDDRYSLTIKDNGGTYTVNDITHKRFEAIDYPIEVRTSLLPNDFAVAIASEESSGNNQQCEFYVPSDGSSGGASSSSSSGGASSGSSSGGASSSGSSSSSSSGASSGGASSSGSSSGASGSGASSGASGSGSSSGGAPGPDEAAVCGRTVAVKEAIEAQFSKDCDDVTLSDLQSLGYQDNLVILENSVTSLQAGDFAGLTNLGILSISNTQLTTLPVNVFNGLSRLQTLDLRNNQLTSLRENILQPFRGGVLLSIRLDNNRFTSLPENLFDGLGSVERIELHNNQLGPSLPGDLLDGLRNLYKVDLRNNQLTSLPAGFFDDFSPSFGSGEIYLRGNNFPQAERTRLEGVLGNNLRGGW